MGPELSLDDLLVAHAAGRLPEPVALIVATHLVLSPASRTRYRQYEAIGGMLLEGIEPAPLADSAWSRVCSRLDQPPREPDRPRPPLRDPRIPAPLCAYLPNGLAGLRWRRYGGLAEADLGIATSGYRASLFTLRAGRAVPRHTHAGHELTLVLDGGFTDANDHYGRGDLAIADASIDHRPRADDDGDCLCLTVTDAPIRLTGALGRWLNPFLRM
jgi:putative transcriptional regulator